MAHPRAPRRRDRAALAQPPRARGGHPQEPDEPRRVRAGEAQAGRARRQLAGRARRASHAEQERAQAVRRPDRGRLAARPRLPRLPHPRREAGVRQRARQARRAGARLYPAGKEMKTRITELLGIQHPIFQAAMSWASSNAPLVIAVSNAGGMGILAAGPVRTEVFRKTLQELSEGTSKPFGVNMPLNDANAPDMLAIAEQARNPVNGASQGGPREHLARVRAVGTKWLHVVASVEHAKKAEAAGVDGLVVDGGEAGGHPPASQVSTLVLVRRVAKSVSLPIVA